MLIWWIRLCSVSIESQVIECTFASSNFWIPEGSFALMPSAHQAFAYAYALRFHTNHDVHP